ncbi:MAG: 50S ribosomal protein L23 [Patescibacteria group bacterium]
MENPLLYPLVSEKNTSREKGGKYTFAIAKGATKVDVKRAFKQIYGVVAVKVNVVNQIGKTRLAGRGRPIRKRASMRKAIITTKGKKTVDVFKVK